jgi:peptide/nickel transport system permease protein
VSVHLGTRRRTRSDTGKRTFFSCFLHQPLGVAAAVFLLGVIVATVLAPVIAPFNPDAQDLNSALALPSTQHLLGTDELGRDVLSRLLYGGGITLIGVVEALGVALIVSVPIGLFAAFRGQTLGAALDRLADLGLAIPAIIVLLMIFSLPGGNQNVAMLILGLLFVASLYRVVRGAALPLRQATYVVNAEMTGVSRPKILWRHILPGVAGPLVVYTSLTAAVILTLQTGLNFLGLGVRPPTPSWGGMISEGLTAIQQQSWLLVPPGVLVGLTILACVLIGDASRDALAAKWHLEAKQPKPTSARAAIASPEDEDGGSRRNDLLLHVHRVSVATDAGQNSVPITTNVSFDIAPGEAVGLVGESGCGKSITALALLGLLPPGTRLVGGHGWLQGREILRRRGRRGDGEPLRFGYVAQDPMTSLDPCFTVFSQVTEIVRRHGDGNRAAARERTRDLLARVRIADVDAVGRRYPHQLSGGLAQRVQIAMALATDPALIVADEPTTALDVTTQAEILDLLRDLREGTGAGLLLITHDWGVVADTCDRAVVMYAGEVVEQGSTKALVREPLHPYTRALLLSNPQQSTPGHRLATIPGSVPVVGGWEPGCRFSPRCPYARPECLEAPVELRDFENGRITRCLYAEELRLAEPVRFGSRR